MLTFCTHMARFWWILFWGRYINALWRSSIPSKAIVFACRLFWQRLPTREALARRGIISSDQGVCCVFCFCHNESVNHLFFACSFSYGVWPLIHAWLGIDGVSHVESVNHFLQQSGFFKYKHLRKVRYLIRCAVV